MDRLESRMDEMSGKLLCVFYCLVLDVGGGCDGIVVFAAIVAAVVVVVFVIVGARCR